MATNTTVALLVLAGGAAVGYVAIKDPPGGLTGALGNVLRGQPQAGRVAATAADAVAYAPAFLTGTGGATTAAAGSPGSSAGGAGAAVVAMAATYEGAPYRYGGSTPAGFDCSGFTQWCYKHAAGISLPRTAAAQQLAGSAVGGVQNAQPGDILFFGFPAYHCGIYKSPGRMIAAPHTGDVVKEQSIYTTPTTISRYLAARPASSPRVISA